MTIQVLKCNQCNHQWVPRIADVVQCPKCKSPRWDQEQRNSKPKRGTVSVITKKV